MFICEKCGKTFMSKQSYGGHISSHNRGDSYKIKRKKKEKQKEKKCKYCGIEVTNGWKLGAHITNCKINPKYSEISKKRKNSALLRIMPENVRNSISLGMKSAHAEKRAWNIGKSRWNSKKSYPEKFFQQVIENEFLNKEYVSEYPVGIYSIDFAWPTLKLAIEIDGEQHNRFEEYKERDKRKDEYLKEHGWQILRISWKELFNNTKYKIKEAYEFIHLNKK